ncbi:MAG: type VI secretion system lipoprotein TssJ [Deltaproteobacteria bacterium]|nr:type VI secretion system lipoprotein TssJ [Deltaproteobacteria bacterium]
MNPAAVSRHHGAGVLVACSVLSLAPAGCKPTPPSCSPDTVKWRVQLALQASSTINASDRGESLPTVVRVFQLKGDLALDGLDFDGLWQADEASALGESFLSMQEITMFPDRHELREIPVEDGATHMLAAGLFREPVSTSWYTSYALPTAHPDTVCARAPGTKVYPNPCFYLRLDRNLLDGGQSPPPGYEARDQLRCAPLLAAPQPATNDPDDRRGRRQRSRRDRLKKVDRDTAREGLDAAAHPPAPAVPASPSVPSAPARPHLPFPAP